MPELPCACANLRRAARAVTGLYDDALRPAGLRSTQFTLLQFLSEAGEVKQRDLGRMLALDSTTLTRSLGHLEKNRWVRSRPGEDRRERYLSLGPAGQRKLREARPLWNAVQQRLRRGLGREAWADLGSLLTGVAAAARAG